MSPSCFQSKRSVFLTVALAILVAGVIVAIVVPLTVGRKDDDSGVNPGLEEDTTYDEQCIHCTDYPSPSMADTGMTCSSFGGLADNCGAPGSPWLHDNDRSTTSFCEYSCYEAGVGYPNIDTCCLASLTETVDTSEFLGFFLDSSTVEEFDLQRDQAEAWFELNIWPRTRKILVDAGLENDVPLVFEDIFDNFVEAYYTDAFLFDSDMVVDMVVEEYNETVGGSRRGLAALLEGNNYRRNTQDVQPGANARCLQAVADLSVDVLSFTFEKVLKIPTGPAKKLSKRYLDTKKEFGKKLADMIITGKGRRVFDFSFAVDLLKVLLESISLEGLWSAAKDAIDAGELSRDALLASLGELILVYGTGPVGAAWKFFDVFMGLLDIFENVYTLFECDEKNCSRSVCLFGGTLQMGCAEGHQDKCEAKIEAEPKNHASCMITTIPHELGTEYDQHRYDCCYEGFEVLKNPFPKQHSHLCATIIDDSKSGDDRFQLPSDNQCSKCYDLTATADSAETGRFECDVCENMDRCNILDKDYPNC